MTVHGMKCRVCQQGFHSKGLLSDHLQNNPSHKQRTATPKDTQPRSQAQSRFRLNDNALVAAERPDIRSRTTNSDQDEGAQPLWLRVTAEQDIHIRQLVTSMCHPIETLRSCQYHLENRTRTELEQQQRCCNCHSKRFQGRTEGMMIIGRRNDPRSANEICHFHADNRKIRVSFHFM